MYALYPDTQAQGCFYVLLHGPFYLGVCLCIYVYVERVECAKVYILHTHEAAWHMCIKIFWMGVKKVSSPLACNIN